MSALLFWDILYWFWGNPIWNLHRLCGWKVWHNDWRHSGDSLPLLFCWNILHWSWGNTSRNLHRLLDWKVWHGHWSHG